MSVTKCAASARQTNPFGLSMTLWYKRLNISQYSGTEIMMLKTLFTLLVGGFFTAAAIILVGIYWLVGLLARIAGLILMPFHRLFSGR